MLRISQQDSQLVALLPPPPIRGSKGEEERREGYFKAAAPHGVCGTAVAFQRNSANVDTALVYYTILNILNPDCVCRKAIL